MVQPNVNVSNWIESIWVFMNLENTIHIHIISNHSSTDWFLLECLGIFLSMGSHLHDIIWIYFYSCTLFLCVSLFHTRSVRLCGYSVFMQISKYLSRKQENIIAVYFIRVHINYHLLCECCCCCRCSPCMWADVFSIWCWVQMAR